MIEKTYSILEFEKIKNQLKEFTLSDLGKKLVDKMKPSNQLGVIINSLNIATEARIIIEKSANIPLHGLYDICHLLDKIEMGGILYPVDLIKVSSFLRGCTKMKRYMKNHQFSAPILSSYMNSITDFGEIESEIESSIEGNSISSKASSSLAKVRRKIENHEMKIEDKLQSIISSSKYKLYIQDFYISKRNDRFVVPVKSSYKNFMEGSVVDTSSTGSTVFIEPASIGKISSELKVLKAEEEAEEYQILATITGYIGLYIKEIRINIEVMSEYDFAFAKGKYSCFIQGIAPKVNDKDYINIIAGKHPLLIENAVPLNFQIGKEYRTLVITGPNTGGKTVALKTIGLLTLMAQSGLHVPASEGTELAVFNNILVDIGDNQSIEQSLSTFSGHMKNLIEIINKSSYSTLILLDEVGTGTDPSEGAALAAAILDELYRNGSITVATTHYGEIKDFSEQHDGFQNGCMEFNPENLKPLYKLSIGKVGKSNAFWISENLGLRSRVLNNAKKYLKSSSNQANKKIFQIENSSVKQRPKKKGNTSSNSNIKESFFRVGDSVIINDNKCRGIVYSSEDEYGNIVLKVNKKFITINKRRVTLHIRREELYPKDYDFDSIFVPWKKRKLERDISRGALKKEDLDLRLRELNEDKND